MTPSISLCFILVFLTKKKIVQSSQQCDVTRVSENDKSWHSCICLFSLITIPKKSMDDKLLTRCVSLSAQHNYLRNILLSLMHIDYMDTFQMPNENSFLLRNYMFRVKEQLNLHWQWWYGSWKHRLAEINTNHPRKPFY